MLKSIIFILAIKSYFFLNKKCTFYFAKDSVYYDLKDTRRARWFKKRFRSPWIVQNWIRLNFIGKIYKQYMLKCITGYSMWRTRAFFDIF